MTIKDVLPIEGGKDFFENRKIDVNVDCDELKIRENRKCNVLPTVGREQNLEGLMLDLHFRYEVLKVIENRK